MARLDPVPYAMPTAGMAHPQTNEDYEKIRLAEERFWEALEDADEEADKNGTLIGALVTFPIADGRACYRVSKVRPLTLQHIPIGDGYRIPDAHMRGLTERDIKQHVVRNRAMRKMFGKHKLTPPVVEDHGYEAPDKRNN